MGDRIWKPVAALGGAALVALALGAAGLPGDARAQVYIGGSGEPSVSVDMGVLDSLGPAPTVPGLLMPRGAPVGRTPAPGNHIVLTPPGAESTGTGRVQLHPPHGTPRLARRAPAHHKSPSKTAARRAPAKAPAQVARRAPEEIAPPPPPAMTPPAALAPAPDVKAPSVKAPEIEAPAMNTPAPPTMEAPPKVATPAPPSAPTVTAPTPPAAPARSAPPAPPLPAPTPRAQTASLGPSGTAGQVSLPFAADSATLDSSAKAALDSIAARADKDQSLRLQLLAFASGTGDTASRARRLSLSRALAVRSYLIDKGVRSTRIDVRALGNRVDGGGSADRVDITVSRR